MATVAEASQTLILHAHTIRLVFEKMAVLYKDKVGISDLDDAALDIVGTVDADTFAEVLEAAKQVDES